MKTTLCFFVVVLILSCQRLTTPTPAPVAANYNFAAVDKLLQDNLNGAYRGKVYAQVNVGDKMVYAKEMGGYTASSSNLIASCTKTFSAAVILALVDEGKLNLDDPIGKYIPAFNQYNKGTPTIRQCFSHTSGFVGSEDEDALTSKTMTLEQAVNTIAKDMPLTSKPGTAFSYGGISMHIAGRVAEVASGKIWNQLFEEKLVNKLGLKNSFFIASSATNPRISGGMISSPNDLMKLANMILNKGLYNGQRVLSEKSCDEFWKDQTNKAKLVDTPYIPGVSNNPYGVKEVRYGMGCWLDVQNPANQYVEQISADGLFGTVLWIDRCRGTTGVVFTMSSFTDVRVATPKIIDEVRKQVGGGC